MPCLSGDVVGEYTMTSFIFPSKLLSHQLRVTTPIIFFSYSRISLTCHVDPFEQAQQIQIDARSHLHPSLLPSKLLEPYQKSTQNISVSMLGFRWESHCLHAYRAIVPTQHCCENTNIQFAPIIHIKPGKCSGDPILPQRVFLHLQHKREIQLEEGICYCVLSIVYMCSI